MKITGGYCIILLWSFIFIEKLSSYRTSNEILAMNIPLDSFELEIDETILKRGLSYFKKGAVILFERTEANTFEAVVEGTEDYQVKMRIENGELVQHSCTCPYDWGPVCKHLAAVLFYHQMDVMGLEAPKKKQRKKSAPGKTVKEKFVERMMSTNPVQIRDYVISLGLEDAFFRRQTMSFFAVRDEGNNIASYKKMLKEVVRANKRQGFIDWRGMRNIGNSSSELLAMAGKHQENGNNQQVIFICLAVVEVMNQIVNYSDDSNGEIMSAIYPAFEAIDKIILEGLEEKDRKFLFDYTTSIYKKKTFSGWDWHRDMLNTAISVCKNQKEAQLLLKLIDDVEGSEYDVFATEVHHYEILKKFFNPDDAQEYLEDHLYNYELREIAIQGSIDNGNLDEAKMLADKGITFDKDDKPGLAHKWEDYLLQIAIKESDLNTVVSLARNLYLNSHQDRDKNYNILKNIVPVEKWDKFVDDLVKDIESEERYPDIHLLAKLLLNEGRFESLMIRLEEQPYLSTMQHYEASLSPHFSKRIAKFYASCILENMEHQVGRNHYQEACRYIRRIKKLGEFDIAEELIQTLRSRYPMRRALREELDKI